MLGNELLNPTPRPRMNQHSVDRSRRSFLHGSLSVGIASALAPALLAESPNSPSSRSANGISELRLQTHKIEALTTFYGQDLGLATRRSGDELVIEAGSTRIVFAAVAEGKPFYHFAFNIPENKLRSAVQWQKSRTELVRRNAEEIVRFEKWNADSIFFRDPAGNLLEYIARHDLNNAAPGDFSVTDILYASEIGLVVDDIPKTVAAANSQLDLGIYRDNSPSFASIGSEHALLVVVPRDRKWFPAREKPAKVFPLTATIRGRKNRELVMDEYDYKVSIE